MSDDDQPDTGLISDSSFQEGAIEAVKSIQQMSLASNYEMLHTKAITWALLELAEQVQLLNSYLRREEKARHSKEESSA